MDLWQLVTTFERLASSMGTLTVVRQTIFSSISFWASAPRSAFGRSSASASLA
jgi:hypothetical protein